MAKLARAVIVRDPNKARDIIFQPGEEPALEYAVLIRNPACWEGGKLPANVKRAIAAQEPESSTGDGQDAAAGDDSSGDGDDKAAPAKKTAARKTAATGRSRGRDAAEEGDSGE